MKIVLFQKTVYLPPWGGTNKSNRLILEALAERGHECWAVAPACGAQACRTIDEFRTALKERQLSFETVDSSAYRFEQNGVRVIAISDSGKMSSWVARTILELEPDWVLVASEDPGQVLLRAALRAAPTRVIYLARTTMALPFGPASPVRSPSGTELLRQTAGIVVASQYLRNYCKRWANLDSVELPISPNGPGPFPYFGRYDSGFVMMLNPCLYKGITIFCALAQALPHVHFAAVPTWGTTKDDMYLLEQTPNISVLAPSDDVDNIYDKARVILVPSLWAEARANVITEAMLRGIPVLASDVGGTSEAKLGVDYLLPVNPITEFTNELDERLLPVPQMRDQPLSIWLDALSTITNDRIRYEKVSKESREAALVANHNETITHLESYLRHH